MFDPLEGALKGLAPALLIAAGPLAAAAAAAVDSLKALDLSRRKTRQVSAPADPRAAYRFHITLGSCPLNSGGISRDPWGLRVMTPDRSVLLPNRRLLGPGDEEGLCRLLGGGARSGEYNAAVLRFGFLTTVACAGRSSTVRSRSRRTAVCSRTCRPSRYQLSGTSRCAWHEPRPRYRSGSISADRQHAISRLAATQ